jgi:hypothetical protein
MLPEGCGWMTPPYWRTTNETWSYARIPYPQGLRGMDGFFTLAFPGSTFAMDPFPCGSYASDVPPASPFALSCVTPRFAPREHQVYCAEPPVPFGRYKDRDSAREDFQARRLETSPYRPMADSRWGDIFDVLMDAAPGDVLQQYPVLVVLGPVALDASLRDRLRDYAEAGGTVVMAAGVARPEDGDLCGVRIEPELRAGRAWQWEDGPFEHEAFRYCPAEAGPDVDVLARTPGGDPLVARHSLGRGAVWTCLVPWFEAEGRACAGLARRLFDEVIGAVQPVSVDGLPVEWLSARGEKDYTVVVANNDGAPWRGTVSTERVPEAWDSCRELLTQSTIAFSRAGDRSDCVLEVPAYDVRAVRWSAGD